MPRTLLETLRQPLEDGQVTISRANLALTFPSRFMLIGAMNPCPCGFYGDSVHPCKCTLGQINGYRQRLSGPLLDRIDVTLEVARLPVEKLVRDEPVRSTDTGVHGRDFDSDTDGSVAVLTHDPQLTASAVPAYGDPSVAIKQRVTAARFRQYARHHGDVTNAALSSKQVRSFCQLDAAGQSLLARAVERLGLSARAYERIRKVARTIADLEGSEHIQVPHLAEAIQYRSGEERLRS
jgi:magnesium chelatase family protein